MEYEVQYILSSLHRNKVGEKLFSFSLIKKIAAFVTVLFTVPTVSIGEVSTQRRMSMSGIVRAIDVVGLAKTYK